MWMASGASACGTCSVGDPTLTVVGFEQPKANRVRTSATLRHRNDSIGETAVDKLTLSEQRLELAGAYSPTDRVSLSLMMPLVHRLITEARWQSGYAAACKAVDAGSIPTLASISFFAQARVAELVDATDLKSVFRKEVWVRVPPRAP